MYTLRERAEWIFAFSEIASHLLPTKRGQINYQIQDLIFEFQECYTLPDFDGMTDTIHPITGLTTYGGKSEADVRKEHPTILRMTVEAFCQKKAELQNAAVEWMPTDQATYYDRLEALPPEFMDGSRFLLGEPMDHCAKSGLPRFEGYCARNGRYFYTSRPVTVRDFKVLALP
jgi:hypothetical protein